MKLPERETRMQTLEFSFSGGTNWDAPSEDSRPAALTPRVNNHRRLNYARL